VTGVQKEVKVGRKEVKVGRKAGSFRVKLFSSFQ
jgi:hypothetical protein